MAFNPSIDTNSWKLIQWSGEVPKLDGQLTELMLKLSTWSASVNRALAQPVSGGGGPSTVSASWGETPSGAVNSSNLSFTTAFPYQAGMLSVYLNGVRQKKPNDYSEINSTTFAFVNAPITGDSVTVDYFR